MSSVLWSRSPGCGIYCIVVFMWAEQIPVMLCLLPCPSVTFTPQLHQSAGGSEHRGLLGTWVTLWRSPAQLTRDAFHVLPLTRGKCVVRKRSHHAKFWTPPLRVLVAFLDFASLVFPLLIPAAASGWETSARRARWDGHLCEVPFVAEMSAKTSRRESYHNITELTH